MRPTYFEILAEEISKLGHLCLRRRALLSSPDTIVTEVTLNHELLMSSYITSSERALASFALEMHPERSLCVLVGGLGLGYTAHEALSSPRVAAVHVVEFLPEVIGWLERGLVPLANELRSDERMKVMEGDVYAQLDGPAETKYDLILIDVDHSPADHLGSESSQFYTDRGLARARLHLKPGGVLGVWSYAQHSPFADSMRRTFSQVRVEAVTVMNRLIDEEQTDWLFFGKN